jgi:hypothetical protein
MAWLKGPTSTTIKLKGAIPAILKGFSPMPGSQAITNCPGAASISPSKVIQRDVAFRRRRD